MAEIEIRTTGELRRNGDVVGQITFARPFIEGDVAGRYADGCDDWFCDCGGDIDEDRISDLTDEVEGLKNDKKTLAADLVKAREENTVLALRVAVLELQLAQAGAAVQP